MSIGGISGGPSFNSAGQPSFSQLMQYLQEFFTLPSKANEDKVDSIINALIARNPKLKDQLEHLKQQINNYFSLSRKLGVLEESLKFAKTASEKNQIESQIQNTTVHMQDLQISIQSLGQNISNQIT